MSPEQRSELDRRYRVALVINVALASSLGVYVIIVEIIKLQVGSVAWIPYVDFIRYAFLGAGLLMFPFVRFVDAVLLKKTREETPEMLLARLSGAAIVKGVLCELPGILGLVLFMLTRQSNDFYMLVAISVVMYLVYFPRHGRWQEWLSSPA